MNIKERAKKFLEELRLPVSRFAQDVNLSASSVRKWLNGDLELGDTSTERIEDFLKSFNR